MKTRTISLLILLLFQCSCLVHARKADIRVIDSQILLANDSVHVRLTLKALDLPSDYRMDLTPVIWSQAEQVLLPSVRISGNRNRRSQERKELFGSNAPKDVPLTVASSDTLFYEAALPYEPWMNHASLRIDNRLSGCCSSQLLSPTLAAADLALTLPSPKPPVEVPIVAPATVKTLSSTEQLARTENFIRRDEMYETEKRAANFFRDPDALRIFFRQGRVAIDTTYMDNAATLDRLDRALHVMTADTAIHITRLVVVGYASIEGTLRRNTYLAEKRATILQEYATARGVPKPNIETVNMGEGWDELRDIVATSGNVPCQKEILRIIDTVPVSGGREKQLMDLRGGVPYSWMMKHLFPQQRNAGYIRIYYTGAEHTPPATRHEQTNDATDTTSEPVTETEGASE